MKKLFVSLIVPILAKVSLPFLSTNVLHPFIAGGPVFGFRLDCSISFINDAAGD